MKERISPINTKFDSKLGHAMSALGFEHNYYTNEWIEPTFPTPFIGRVNLEEVNDVGNGCGTLTRGSLNDFYNIEIKRGKNGRIESFRIKSRRRLPKTFKQNIPESVKKALLVPGVCCPVNGNSNHLEIDHKDGRKPVTCWNPEDFQVLSKAANDSKRQACKNCKKTCKRFNAMTMGYPMAFTKGTEAYEGTCEGCFWYDVKDFRSHLSFKQD